MQVIGLHRFLGFSFYGARLGTKFIGQGKWTTSMDARAQFSIAQVYVLERGQLEKIYKLIKDRIGEPEIKAKCADGLERDFPDLKRLLEYENPRDRGIASLSITARSEDFKKYVEVSFVQHRWETISVSIKGAETTVARLKEELSEIVDGTKPWYWPLAEVDFSNVATLVFSICLGMIISIQLTVDLKTRPSDFELTNSIMGSVIGVIAMGIAWLCVKKLNRFWQRFFPLAVFMIGQEIKKFEETEKVRWGIIVASFVGFAVTFISALF
jgi:hypothetical protein